MVLSNKLIITLCLTLFISSPILVFANNSTTTQNESKIYVTVKPNNTIVVQPPDNAKLDELLQQLSNNESKVIKGDTLISSSTIVGLFGFGSFIAMRFRGSNIGRQGTLMQLVYLSSFMVIIFHLSIIYVIIVLDKTDTNWYTFVIIVTGIAIAVIAGAMMEITGLQVREAKDKERTVDRLHMVAERERRLGQEKISEEIKDKTNSPKTTKADTTKGKTEGDGKKSAI